MYMYFKVHYNTIQYNMTFCIFILAPNVYTENEQVAKYEIMDGAPVRGNITSQSHDIS